VPGKSGESLLLELAAHGDKPIMPPHDNKASARDLTPEQLALLKLWIDQGARGEVHAARIEWRPIAANFTPAYATAVTPDAHFAAIGRANRLDLYDLATQQLLAPLADPHLPDKVAHRDSIYSLAFGPDGMRLASGAFGEVKVWRKSVPSVVWSSKLGLEDVTAASGDGRLIAVVAEEGVVHLIDAATGKTARVLAKPSRPVKFLRFSPDNAHLLLASEKSICVCKIGDGGVIGEVTAPAEIRAVAWTHGGKELAVGCADHVVRRYRLSDKSLLPVGADLKGHAGPVTALAALLPGTQLLSGDSVGVIRLWDLEGGKEIRQFANTAAITSIAVCSDGKRFASADASGVVKLWDFAAGGGPVEIKGDPVSQKIARELETDDELAAADVGYFTGIVTAAQGNEKAQRDRLTKAQAAKTVADKAVVEKQALVKSASDAKSLAAKALADATAQRDKARKALDDAEKLTKPATRPAATQPASAPAAKGKAVELARAALAKDEAALKPATDHLAASVKQLANAEAALKAAQLPASNAANEVELATASVTRASQSVAEAQLAVTQAEGRKKKTAEDFSKARAAATAASAKPIRSLAFSPDGRTFAVAREGSLFVYSAATGLPIEAIALPKSQARWAGFVDEKKLLVCSTEHVATVLDVSTRWTLERTLGTGDADSPLSDRVNALAFSPDGRIVATGAGEPSRGGQIKLWDVASGNLIRDLKDAHSDAVLALAFSRDGTRLASGAADRFVRVFETASGRRIFNLEGHAHHVLSLGFKADGRTLVSGAADGQAKLWNLVTGERTGNIPVVSHEITSARFLGTSEQALLGASDGLFRVINAAGAPVRSFNAPAADYVQATSLAGDGKTLTLATQSGTLYVYDAATGKLQLTLLPPKRD
jgi:WD40 repeat protein